MKRYILPILLAALYLAAPAQSISAISPGDFEEFDFEEIDQHALNAPAWAEESVEALAAYLVEPARNDLEKARAIYRWITENIDYDAEGIATGSYGDMSPEGVLRSHVAVCEGYGGLFESLAVAAGLEAVKISGYAKGYRYDLGSVFEGPTNHAWNAVKINGTWYLLDSTWGAGYMDENDRFVPEFEDYHFLTPPDEFIYRHFPDDPRWQLLESPISKSEFELLVYLRPAFFKYGLELKSNVECIIVIDNETTISLFVPDDVMLTAELSGGDLKLPKSLTFAQRESDHYTVYVVLPDAGNYTLSLFAKRKGEPGNNEWAADYRIAAKSGKDGRIGYPLAYGAFLEEGARLYMPMTYHLSSGNAQAFRLEVPGAGDVVVFNGDEFTHLTKEGEIFEGEVVLVEGDAKVYASYSGSESYDGLLKYTAL